MQRATEIKQRIRARHPDLIYYPDLLTFKTKYRHKLADDNTLYTTFRGVLSNAAVLVYKHTALDIYIVANLDLTIIPVAKALWATINGSRPDQALSSIEQLMFFETTTQNWRVLGHHALKSVGRRGPMVLKYASLTMIS